MANLAASIKAEITRLAKKEIRVEITSLKKASTSYRTQIAQLKLRAKELERNIARLQKDSKRTTESVSQNDGEATLRWRHTGFATLRTKLGLSAADMGRLLGVSQLTIYKWEKGQSTPRAAQLKAISEVRKIGKKEAAKRLEQAA